MSNGSSPERPPIESVRSSRRSLLKAASGAALSASFFDRGFTSASAEAHMPIYEGNQPIEIGFTTIQREGWNFLINLEEIKEHTAKNGTEIEISAQGYKRDAAKFVYKNGQVMGNDFIRLPKDGIDTGVLEILPRLESDGVLVLVRERDKNGETVGILPTFAKLDHQVYESGAHSDRRRIWTEVDIDPEILQEMHERAQRFDVFQDPNCPTFVFEPRYGSRSALHNPGERFIKIPGKYFQNQAFLDAGAIILDHERFHSTQTADTLTTLAARKADVALDEEHQSLWLQLGGDGQTSDQYGLTPEPIATHPAFRVFDESTYFPGLRDVDALDSGHPFSNYKELYASGMNCITRVGAAVVDEIEGIRSDEEQEQAKRFGAKIVDEAFAIAGDSNALIEEFPRITEVTEYFKAA